MPAVLVSALAHDAQFADVVAADAHPLARRRAGRGSRAIPTAAPRADRQLAAAALAGVNRWRPQANPAATTIIYRTPAMDEPVPIATHGAHAVILITANLRFPNTADFNVIVGHQPVFTEGWLPKNSEHTAFESLDEAVAFAGERAGAMRAEGWIIDYRDSGVHAVEWGSDSFVVTRDKVEAMVRRIERSGAIEMP